MLLTKSNCLAGPRDSRVLTSSPLNRRLVRECVPDGARMLPPNLYLVVFYQVSLVNRTKMICSYIRRPLEVLVVLHHMFIAHGGILIRFYSMIVSIKDLVS